MTKSDICEAWHKAHLIVISLNADNRIKELQCALTCWQIVSDEDNEFDEGSAEQVINLASRYQQARKVALLAFTEWVEEHEPAARERAFGGVRCGNLLARR